MAASSSSENLAAVEPWMFPPTLPDSWISEAFARDSETLTKALQQSLSSNRPDNNNNIVSISPFFNLQVKPDTRTASLHTPSASGSDPETTPPPKSRNSAVAAYRRKITKRKSRASKRSTTTFITADPANFRQMVQQVTGVKIGNGQMPVAHPLLKPEPQRPSFNRLQGCLMPTLDTSAILLDYHHQQQQQEVMVPRSPEVSQLPPPVSIADGGFDFESFSSFPTLDSLSYS